MRVGRGKGFGEALFFWGAMTLFTAQACRKKEFDVIHAHGTLSGLSAVVGSMIGRIPFILSFHQDALIGWETGYNRLGGFKYNLTRLLQATICNFAAVVTVQSSAVKDITQRVLGLNDEEKMALLPNTVDVAKFSADDSPPPANRSILCVGNLIKRKGVDVLLGSVAILVRAFPDVKLTVAGTGPERANLQRLASDLNISANVNFVGEVDDKTLAAMYRSAEVVVLASYSEVFGVVILEALAAHRPVVATATVGAKSIITDRVSGRIVPIGDSSGIALAIADYFSDHDSAAEIARTGHQLGLTQYSVEAVCERLQGLYQSNSSASHKTAYVAPTSRVGVQDSTPPPGRPVVRRFAYPQDAEAEAAAGAHHS